MTDCRIRLQVQPAGTNAQGAGLRLSQDNQRPKAKHCHEVDREDQAPESNVGRQNLHKTVHRSTDHKDPRQRKREAARSRQEKDQAGDRRSSKDVSLGMCASDLNVCYMSVIYAFMLWFWENE